MSGLKFEGQVALVTGASRGMGESHAKTFIEHGDVSFNKGDNAFTWSNGSRIQ